MTAKMGLWASQPGPCTKNPANAALVRVRRDIARQPHIAPIKHVERMFDFLWRMSSAYSYGLYGYYENHQAFRVLSRYMRLHYAAEKARQDAAA